MSIDFLALSQIRDVKTQAQLAREMIAADPDGIYLSDVLIRAGYEGGVVLIELAKLETTALRSRRKPQTWNIFVLRDQWGNVPGPGDKVIKIDKRPDLGTSGNRNIAKLDGSYAERYEDRIEYEVDEKGCITCTFTDAGHFLNLWGVHGRTNRTMTTKPEHSEEPCDCPGGGKKHVWYWRYKEVTAAEYEKLPRRKGEQRK